ncbi:MAG: ATP-dependent DNA ligase [Clostridia bacterium]|nr:ATP-dependent DNA ligase [Deltaproteobacteria bacterium]
MKGFADLYDALDQTTSTNAKVVALVEYFSKAAPADAAWALFFLTGRRFKRLMNVRQLGDWVGEATGLPGWLIEESYASVGDLAETIALLLDNGDKPRGTAVDLPLHVWLEDRIAKLGTMTVEEQHATILQWWNELAGRELFILTKLLTGSFRVGVSATLVTRAIAKFAQLPADAATHRLMGNWEPTPAFFKQLISKDVTDTDRSRPYPFFLASSLESTVAELGAITDWQAEWKWDGIRAQLMKRDGKVHLWSRGEEVITERFPEITLAAERLPDGTVLDGEVLAYRDGRPLVFAVLQQRIGRSKLNAKVLADAPVVFMAYDLVEYGGVDIRETVLTDRRVQLESLVAGLPEVLKASPVVTAESWEVLAEERVKARELAVEGLMLKRKTSPYRSGRKRGDWWKWKIDPYAVDAVLIYAQPGSGKRAGLYTDYTFGVWQNGVLTPVAKAYSGLDDKEIAKLDRWIRAHTVEKFGPVRSVEPVHVFELHFEAIQRSTRHKSGVAVRFPRIARWRTDKTAAEADTLDTVRGLAAI